MTEQNFLTASTAAPAEKRFAVPQQDGVLVLYKPKGPTSAACIGKIKRVLSQKKIGHAGTLDPMAEGVLLVLLGQGTKISGHLMGEDDHKVYSGIIRLGVETDTWDAEGETVAERPVSVNAEDAAREFAALVGTYEQEVPPYSAAKHEGKPLYALARAGKPTPVKKKTVTISRGEAELVGPERIHFRVTCSSGTYIRSLAHSLGSRLGCGACLERLTREYSRPFGVEQAHSLDDVLADPEGFARKVKGIADALPDRPCVVISKDDAALVRNGGRPAFAGSDAGFPFMPGMKGLLLSEEGTPLALAETVLENGREVWASTRGLWNQ